MAKGFGFVREASQERAARSGGSSVWAGKLIFKLPDDGDTAVVRFLEDEDGDFIYGAWHHDVPVEKRAWPDQVVCIAQDDEGQRTDDPCPGCEHDLKLRERYFVRVLWKDAPVYKLDDKNKIVKDNTGDPVILDHKDQIAVWSSGPRLAENLEEIHEAYKLGSREFLIKRKGTGIDTEYVIRPAEIDGGPQKPSAADKKVISDSDVELADFIKPPSYEDFERRLNGGFSGGSKESSNGSSGGSSEPAATKSNPFKRNKKG